MAVTSRDRAAFDQNVLSWAQMDSTLAIVLLNGHEVYLDPGTPLCPFGYLAPQHTNVIGISIEGKLVKTHYTPAQPAAASLTDRRATLQLSANGTVTGAIKITFTGSAGLNLRADSISEDQAAVETSLEKNMQASVPPGVQLKLASLTGLSNPDSPIVASFTVNGTLGTTTKTRLVFSEQFFQANAKALPRPATRSFRIAFPGAYGVRDIAAIQIPSDFRLEAQPAPQSLSLKSDTFYKTSIQIMTQATSTQSHSPPFLVIQRVFALGRLDYPQRSIPPCTPTLGKSPRMIRSK
jgi:hypothetical protein